MARGVQQSQPCQYYSAFYALDGSTKEPLEKRSLFFPRYHQLEVVRRLIADVSEQGVGKRYLIQHSAARANLIPLLGWRIS